MIVTKQRGAVVSEIVGRTAAPTLTVTATKTIDTTQSQYEFWSKLLRGKERGYELGALFAKRIVEIDSEWTLGRGFTCKTGNEDVDGILADWVTDALNDLLTWRKEANGLGDSYIVLNGDGSLALKSPDTCEILTDDFNQIIGYRFTDRFDTVTVVDTYTADRRLLDIKRSGETNAAPLEFPNPIAPLIPVVHLANDIGVNERYGHPIYEGLLPLFANYNDVITKTIAGTSTLGRPILYVTGLKNPQAEKENNATRTERVWNEEIGTFEYQPVIDMDEVEMFFFGEGAQVGFAQPGPFAEQSAVLLKKLFYLMLEHTGIPEWVWGGAVASSKASVDAQMPAFIRYLEGRRAQTEKALLQLVERWLAYQRVIGFLPVIEDIEIEWPELQSQDEEIRFKWVEWADKTGKLTSATALRLADLVADPTAEVEAATAESQDDETAFNEAIRQQMATMNQPNSTDTATDETDDNPTV